MMHIKSAPESSGRFDGNDESASALKTAPSSALGKPQAEAGNSAGCRAQATAAREKLNSKLEELAVGKKQLLGQRLTTCAASNLRKHMMPRCPAGDLMAGKIRLFEQPGKTFSQQIGNWQDDNVLPATTQFMSDPSLHSSDDNQTQTLNDGPMMRVREGQDLD
eukprot:scaffold140895_cov21-Prasinocladus_malaysianus.AAC.2